MSYSANPADVLATLAERAGITLDQGKLARLRSYCDEPVECDLKFDNADEGPFRYTSGMPEKALAALRKGMIRQASDPLRWPHGGPKVFTGGPGGEEVLVPGDLAYRRHEPRGPVLEAPFERFRLALDGVVCPSCNRHLTWDKLPAGCFAPGHLELFGRFGTNGTYAGELVARVTCGNPGDGPEAGCFMSSAVRCPVQWAT